MAQQFLNAYRQGRNSATLLAVFLALVAALALTTGCITVPDGTDEAFAANGRILEIVAVDQERELAERAAFDATLKQLERERLFGEWLDNIADDLSETTDTARLRPEFVAYGFRVEQAIKDFDKPLDTWARRGAERAKWTRQAIRNQSDTLDALRAAQITLEADANGTR